VLAVSGHGQSPHPRQTVSHREPRKSNQVGEDEATLPAREPTSVEHDTVGFDCVTPCEEDPQLYGSGHPLGLSCLAGRQTAQARAGLER
jgi:hypothetical protein